MCIAFRKMPPVITVETLGVLGAEPGTNVAMQVLLPRRLSSSSHTSPASSFSLLTVCRGSRLGLITAWPRSASSGLSCIKLSSFGERRVLLRDDLRRRATSAARSSDFKFVLSRLGGNPASRMTLALSTSRSLSSFFVCLVALRDGLRRRTTSAACLSVKSQPSRSERSLRLCTSIPV